MSLREEILREAITGKKCTVNWTAHQTFRLYQEWKRQGLPREDAIIAAKTQMQEIAAEALHIRQKRRRNDLAAWYVIVLGVLACIGWWQLCQ